MPPSENTDQAVVTTAHDPPTTANTSEPAVDDAAPAVDNAAPAVAEAAPAVAEAAPAVDNAAPAVAEAAPAVDNAAPAVDNAAPAVADTANVAAPPRTAIVGPRRHGHGGGEQSRATSVEALEPMSEDELSNRGLFGRLWDGFVRLIPTGFLRFWPVRITILVVSLVRRNRVMSLSAEIAYWMVLSVVPLLLAIASMLGWLSNIVGVDVADQARAQLAEQVTILFGTEGTASTSIDRLFDTPAAGALTLSLITSLLAASRGFISLVSALGLISGHQTQRNWIMTRIIGLLVMLLSLVVLVTLLIVTGVAQSGLGLSSPWDRVASALLMPVTMVLMTGWAAVLLHVAPRESAPVTFDLPGAVLTALWWVVGSYLTARYIEVTSNSTDVLGLLGSGVGVLLWLYVIAVGILIGAQFNAAIRIDRRGPDAFPADLDDLEVAIAATAPD